MLLCFLLWLNTISFDHLCLSNLFFSITLLPSRYTFFTLLFSSSCLIPRRVLCALTRVGCCSRKFALLVRVQMMILLNIMMVLMLLVTGNLVFPLVVSPKLVALLFLSSVLPLLLRKGLTQTLWFTPSLGRMKLSPLF